MKNKFLLIGASEPVPGEEEIARCLKNAKDMANYYIKSGHRQMSDWWLDQADYHVERLINNRIRFTNTYRKNKS